MLKEESAAAAPRQNPAPEEPTRIVIVDDHEIVRSGLRMMLAREPGIHIVGMAESAEKALELIKQVRPDVALVDYSLPGMSGTELCQIIVETHPDIPVIILTTFLDDEVIKQSLEAGAKAYLFKDIESTDLKRAVRQVVEGHSVLDPKVAGRVIAWADRTISKSVPRKKAVLSPREIDILRLIARGASDKEVGVQLGLSVNTVKTYVRRLLQKTGSKSRGQAVAKASRWHII